MPEPHRKFERIAFVAADTAEASEARERLVALYGSAEPLY